MGIAELSRLQQKQARTHARTYEAIRAEAQWRDFTSSIAIMQSPGEPQASSGRITRRDRAQYQGRLWATCRHLWVDRVATDPAFHRSAGALPVAGGPSQLPSASPIARSATTRFLSLRSIFSD